MSPIVEFKNNQELLGKLRQCFMSQHMNIIHTFYKNARDHTSHMDSIEYNSWYNTWSEICILAMAELSESEK